jgi:hypothetical protein
MAASATRELLGAAGLVLDRSDELWQQTLRLSKALEQRHGSTVAALAAVGPPPPLDAAAAAARIDASTAACECGARARGRKGCCKSHDATSDRLHGDGASSSSSGRRHLHAVVSEAHQPHAHRALVPVGRSLPIRRHARDRQPARVGHAAGAADAGEWPGRRDWGAGCWVPGGGLPAQRQLLVARECVSARAPAASPSPATVTPTHSGPRPHTHASRAFPTAGARRGARSAGRRAAAAAREGDGGRRGGQAVSGETSELFPPRRGHREGRGSAHPMLPPTSARSRTHLLSRRDIDAEAERRMAGVVERLKAAQAAQAAAAAAAQAAAAAAQAAAAAPPAAPGAPADGSAASPAAPPPAAPVAPAPS